MEKHTALVILDKYLQTLRVEIKLKNMSLDLFPMFFSLTFYHELHHQELTI